MWVIYVGHVHLCVPQQAPNAPWEIYLSHSKQAVLQRVFFYLKKLDAKIILG